MSFIIDRIRVDTKVAIEKGENAEQTKDKASIKSAIAILQDTQGKLKEYQKNHNILGKIISLICGDKGKLEAIDKLLGRLQNAVAGVIPPVAAGGAPVEAPPPAPLPPVGGMPPPPPPPPPGKAVPGAWRNKAPEGEPPKAPASQPKSSAPALKPGYQDELVNALKRRQQNKPPEEK